jgi:hypothetical protein
MCFAKLLLNYEQRLNEPAVQDQSLSAATGCNFVRTKAKE